MDHSKRYQDLERFGGNPCCGWYFKLFISHSVLQRATNGGPNRAGKGQKKDDWEAELRAELEKKKGTPVKLNAKDQALVNEQIAKESTIRFRVENARQTVSNGLNIIQNLIELPAGLGIEFWYFKALNVLLGGVVQKCGSLVQSQAMNTYLVLVTAFMLT